MAYYLRGHRIPWDEVVRIAYRDGDWPGQIRLRRIGADTDRVIPRIHGNSRWGILRYLAGFQGYWMMKRCRLCPDPLADLADIAVGDPHVPRYRSRRGPGHSIVITRTRRGEQWLRDALSAGRVLLEEMSDAETVRASQGYTLDNRRHASAYVRVARLLGMTAPRMTLDPRVESTVSFRHYKFALFDLAKIRIRRWTWLQPLYPILQAVEYLFITFYPSLFVQRMKRLLLNRGR
jgi:coenzyme F420 hydrogenase subunit beta